MVRNSRRVILRASSAVLAAVMSLALAGCGETIGGFVGGSGVAAAPAAPRVELTASVRDGATAVDPAEPVTVSVTHGRLEEVTLSGPGRAVLQGSTSADGRRWSFDGELVPRTSYRLQAQATPQSGAAAGEGTAVLERAFATGDPARVQKTTTSPSSGSTVGVGHPITLRFDHPVARSARADAERALVVETSKPVGPASWRWLSSTEVHYRPRDYWPANTRVDLHINLTGVRFAEGTWGVHDRTVSFTVGRSQVLEVDGEEHRMQVVRNGKVIRSFGVSLGKSGFETRSGIKAIMSLEKSRRMRSSTIGIEDGPDSYDLVVPYAMRITNSGEFIHGAPWNSNIGSANTSHGCTNVPLEDAKWLVANSMIGDVVETTGTDRDMEAGNGLGGDWNVSWARWVKGSALR